MKRLQRAGSSVPSLLAVLGRSRMARRMEPVFIVGEARSGSTLLFRTLAHHPVFRPRRENLQETSLFVQAWRAGQFTAEAPRNLRRFMLDDSSEWGAFLVSLRPLRPVLRAAAQHRPGRGWDWLTILVCRLYIYHASRARGVGRLLEKTPGHIDHIDRILACFPAARLLYIHRHPVDVYSSYVRRALVDPKADWARIGVGEFTGLIRTRVGRATAAARRHPDSLLLVRYEDFTTHPGDELRRICRFLDIEDRPAIVDDMRVNDGPRWAHWERSTHLFDGIKTHTKHWETYISPHQADRVQLELAEVMETLGHAPYELEPDAELALG